MGPPRTMTTLCVLQWWDASVSYWRHQAVGSEAEMRAAYAALPGRDAVKWRLSWFEWSGSEAFD
jgi:hypothetical protein